MDAFTPKIRSNPVRSALSVDVDTGRLIERVVDLAKRMPDAFARAVEGTDVAGVESDLPQRLVDLVTDRCQRCVAILG